MTQNFDNKSTFRLTHAIGPRYFEFLRFRKHYNGLRMIQIILLDEYNNLSHK